LGTGDTTEVGHSETMAENKQSACKTPVTSFDVAVLQLCNFNGSTIDQVFDS
jgi:hypothetical protein